MRSFLFSAAFLFCVPAQAQHFTTSHQNWSGTANTPAHRYYGNGHHSLNNFHYHEWNVERLNRNYEKYRMPEKNFNNRGYPGYSIPAAPINRNFRFNPDWYNPNW